MSKKLYALTDEQAKLGREIANLVSNLASTSGESGGVARCRDVADALATPLDTDDAVERMARALCSRALLGWAHESAACQNIWRDEARAALGALLQKEKE